MIYLGRNFHVSITFLTVNNKIFPNCSLKANSWFQEFRKMKIPKSRKARFVEQKADPSCKIWFICKGTLVCRRKAIQLSHEEMQECRQSSGVTHSVDKSASLSEMWCVANTWLCKSIGEQQIERTISDPFYISRKVMMAPKLCQT